MYGYRLPSTRTFGIVMIALSAVLCVFCIFIGIKDKRSSEKKLRECTSTAEGVIEKYETFRDSAESAPEYRYSILFTTNEGKRYRYTTRRTGLKHEKGEKVTMHYKPDSESMYSEIDPPSNGFSAFIMAGVAPFFGLAVYLSYRRRYKSFYGLRR